MRYGGKLAFTVEQHSPLRGAAGRSFPRPLGILIVALVFGVTALLVSDAFLQAILGLVAVILLTSAAWLKILPTSMSRPDQDVADEVRAFLETDQIAGLVTTVSGDVLYATPAAHRMTAHEQTDGPGPTSVLGFLQEIVPDPSDVVERMARLVNRDGVAEDCIETPEGALRLRVVMDAARRHVWRFEMVKVQAADKGSAGPMAILQLGPENSIRSMNTAARRMFGDGPLSVKEIFTSGPIKPGLFNGIKPSEGLTAALVVNYADDAGHSHLCLFPREGCHDLSPGDWTFFNHLPVPLLKLSREGTILLSNSLACTLLAQHSVTGRSLSEFVEGLGRSMSDWLSGAAEARGGLHSEFLRIKRQDREVFVQVTLNRAMEEDGPVLIAVLNDATAHKSLEAQFVQSQKMQAIGQLAGGVAHDFNNLLTAITGHCDLLLLRHDQGDPDYADLIQINQNTNRAAALVSQLLAYSRKQTLRPEVMDLRDMLSDLTHLLNRLVGEKVTLSLRHDPMLWSIRADKRQLEQVLMNLVVNARDAMRENGGDIRIETENIELSEPLHYDRAVVAPGRYVQVRVADEGHGIPADKLQKVFEPFYTTKRTGEGTGLGLSTAYGIVKQTGGFIFVDSILGEGTTFRMYFPAHDTVAAEKPTASAPPVLSAPSDGAVLLVEDEAPVRAFASRALQMRGLTVYEADSAEAALTLLEDPSLRVDVFVSDVVMPGIDGPSWVIEALEKRPQTRVVFISGYAEEAFDEVQSRIPNSVFLPKPFSLTELTETVQRQMGLVSAGKVDSAQ